MVASLALCCSFPISAFNILHSCPLLTCLYDFQVFATQILLPDARCGLTLRGTGIRNSQIPCGPPSMRPLSSRVPTCTPISRTARPTPLVGLLVASECFVHICVSGSCLVSFTELHARSANRKGGNVSVQRQPLFACPYLVGSEGLVPFTPMLVCCCSRAVQLDPSPSLWYPKDARKSVTAPQLHSPRP